MYKLQRESTTGTTTGEAPQHPRQPSDGLEHWPPPIYDDQEAPSTVQGDDASELEINLASPPESFVGGGLTATYGGYQTVSGGNDQGDMTGSQVLRLDTDNNKNKDEGGDDDGDDDRDDFEMEEDVYTLMFVYGFRRPSTIYAAIVILMQIVIISLFYVDLLRDKTDVNRFNIPVTVSTQVRIAQFMALPLAIMSHEDCTTSLYQLSAQYDPTIRQRFPEATREKWILTLFLRFAIGFLLIFISFVQIALATTITDLFLNLEAIVFVGNIDNFAFWLAEKNFLKKELRDDCKAVKDITFPSSIGSYRTIIRRVVSFLVYLALIMGWVTVATKQVRGVYLMDQACNSFTVSFPDYTLDVEEGSVILNFGDNMGRSSSRIGYFENNFLTDGPNQEMFYSAFSGSYELAVDDRGRLVRENDRAVYLETYPNFEASINDPARGRFHYCDGAWVFTVPAVQNSFNRTKTQTDRECGGRWLMRSPPTEAFTLEEVSTDGWRIWTGDVEIAQGISILCNDCQDVVDCNYHGQCINRQCVCDDTRSGSRCDTELACSAVGAFFFGPGDTSSIALGTARSDVDFGAVGTFLPLGRDLSSTTSPSNALRVYDRPVYIEAFNPDILDDGFSRFIYFLGNRWGISAWNRTTFAEIFVSGALSEFDDDITTGQPDSPIRPPAHSFWDHLWEGSAFGYSEPTQSGTPFGLQWYAVGITGSRGNFGPLRYSIPITFSLDCFEQDCNATITGRNPCGVYGSCRSDDTCACTDCYSGDYCQYAPTDPYVYNEFVQIAQGSPTGSEYYFTFLQGRDLFAECPLFLGSL